MFVAYVWLIQSQLPFEPSSVYAGPAEIYEATYSPPGKITFHLPSGVTHPLVSPRSFVTPSYI